MESNPSSKSPVQPTSAAPTTTTAPATTTPTTATTATPTTATHEQQPYSSDPFAPNYRHICPWSEEEKADWIATWPTGLHPGYWEVYESAEYAEYTRPWDQLLVLLRQRGAGLYDKLQKIMSGREQDDEPEMEGGRTQPQTQGPEYDDEDGHGRLRRFFRDVDKEGELLERAENIWRTGKLRRQFYEGKVGLQALKEGDVVAYNWIQLNPGLVEANRKAMARRQQGGDATTVGKDMRDEE